MGWYAKAKRWAKRKQAQRQPKTPQPHYSPRVVSNTHGQSQGADVQYVQDQQGAGELQPPTDGAISTCQLGGACGNEIRYSAARARWEHTGKGNAECFR